MISRELLKQFCQEQILSECCAGPIHAGAAERALLKSLFLKTVQPAINSNLLFALTLQMLNKGMINYISLSVIKCIMFICNYGREEDQITFHFYECSEQSQEKLNQIKLMYSSRIYELF